MPRTLFISDLHLDERLPRTLAAFHQFISSEAPKADALYVLGDLFEAWIGDDDITDLSKSVTEAFAQLADSGTAVYLMHGNRDFLLGEQFCKQAKCTLLPDPSVIDLYGQATLLMHGDSLCTADTDYMAFRAQIRNPQMQAGLLAKPIAERRQIAAHLRQNSGEAMSNKAADIMDVTADAVHEVMQEHSVQRLIHGHTHRPKIHTFELKPSGGSLPEKAERVVLGDWGDNLWYLSVNDNAEPSNAQLISQAISPY